MYVCSYWQFGEGFIISLQLYNIQRYQQEKRKMLQDSLFYINRQLIPKSPNQKTLQTYQNVTLEDNNIKVVDLSMQITSHRILLLSANDHAFLVEGCKIKEVVISESGMLWGKEYFVKLRTEYGKLKLQTKNYKQALLTISSMLKNQEWTKIPPPEQTSSAPKMYSGIFNKIEKDKQKIDTNSTKISESFISFESLFSNLKQIKDLMQQMKSLTTDNNGQEQNKQVNQILKDIGFVSVINKEEAGREYMRELAKEIFAICSGTLFKKYGGIVSLLDVFYFYNMKRQMQLVSPQELLQACQQFQKFSLPAKLVCYPNNIKMIESTQFNQKQDFDAQFQQYFKDYRKGYSAEQISRRKNIPLAIIEIKLKKACKRGDLAVDSRIEGVRYFKNLIITL